MSLGKSKLPNYLQEQAYLYRLSKIANKPSEPVDWIQKHFYIPETNAPIRLQPYQQAVIREALRRDNNLFRYSFILWSDLKKSAKSTIAGAIALYLAWHNQWESVRIVGNDLKQADSRTFFYIERAIRLNPALSSQCTIKNYEIKLPNHTVISAIPVDPKGEAGGGDLATVFTEMWAMKNKASQQLWSETTLSPLKFGKSLRIGESYAGFKGESPVLEPLYDQFVKPEYLMDIGIPGLELYRKDRSLCLWNTQPRCDWQTPAYYAQEATSLTPSEFNRLHRNQWAQAVNSFVDEIWWNACKTNLVPLRDKQPIVLALDAAISGDCFGLVGVSRVGDTIQVRIVKKWTPQPRQVLEFSNPNDKNDISRPEGFLRALCRQYNVVCIAYDPYQLHDFSHRLYQEKVAFFQPFNQGAPRAIADKSLYDMIIARRLQHDGNPELKEHILNAGATSEDKNLRLIKLDDSRKIDLAVALSMAADRAMYYNIG